LRANARRLGMDPEIREVFRGNAERGKSVTERCGRISNQELVKAIDSVKFDHGVIDILIARQKLESSEKICNNQGVQKKKAVPQHSLTRGFSWWREGI
jgi:hypothetical protein